MELGPEDVSLLERCPHFSEGVMHSLQWTLLYVISDAQGSLTNHNSTTPIHTLCGCMCELIDIHLMERKQAA